MSGSQARLERSQPFPPCPRRTSELRVACQTNKQRGEVAIHTGRRHPFRHPLAGDSCSSVQMCEQQVSAESSWLYLLV